MLKGVQIKNKIQNSRTCVELVSMHEFDTQKMASKAWAMVVIEMYIHKLFTDCYTFVHILVFLVLFIHLFFVPLEIIYQRKMILCSTIIRSSILRC